MVFRNTNKVTKTMAIILAIAIMIPSTAIFAQDVQAKDYYYEGQATAERDYTGGGAIVGGLASGTLLGLIGWGIGYLVVANQGVDVPRHYTSNYDTTQRMQFEQGYKDYVKKTKKGKFNLGAGIGTLISVVLVLGSSE